MERRSFLKTMLGGVAAAVGIAVLPEAKPKEVVVSGDNYDSIPRNSYCFPPKGLRHDEDIVLLCSHEQLRAYRELGYKG